jgi:hypothetical protein
VVLETVAAYLLDSSEEPRELVEEVLENQESTGEPTYQEHVEPEELVGLETYE